MDDGLREHAELRKFILENAEQFDKKTVLGTGSYGSVQLVKIGGEVYAAKMIHEVLLETHERGGVDNMAENYLRECQLMASIRHPNITQFIGLCFLTGSQLPFLVMERLDSNLDDLLESTPNIPLSVSKYILICVCRGLLHLHRFSVIHRDLTARNVLLTASLRAKITDFGNSRIVHLEPGQLARTLTRFPGTLPYMPPEAVSGNGQYGPSLDVFSFGVLLLFALTQVFPGDLLAPTYPDPNNPDLLLARSEFERRSIYTSLLERCLTGGHEHPLFGVVRECLSNNPERRPTTSLLLSSLEEIGTETEGALLELDIVRVKTVRTLRTKDKRIEALERELYEKDAQLVAKDTMVEQQQQALADKDNIIIRKSREISDKDEIISQQASQLAQKDQQIVEMQALIDTLAAPRDQAEMNALTQLSTLRPQSLTWHRGKNMPNKMGYNVQSVVLGDTVYVGGGDVVQTSTKINDNCTVLKFQIHLERWTKLAPYNQMYFAMTSISNKLVLVGGFHPTTRERSNALAVWDTKWTYPYPPMRVARHTPAVASSSGYLIVIGGRGE